VRPAQGQCSEVSDTGSAPARESCRIRTSAMSPLRSRGAPRPSTNSDREALATATIALLAQPGRGARSHRRRSTPGSYDIGALTDDCIRQKRSPGEPAASSARHFPFHETAATLATGSASVRTSALTPSKAGAAVRGRSAARATNRQSAQSRGFRALGVSEGSSLSRGAA
jgi:hypothetical protein